MQEKLKKLERMRIFAGVLQRDQMQYAVRGSKSPIFLFFSKLIFRRKKVEVTFLVLQISI